MTLREEIYKMTRFSKALLSAIWSFEMYAIIKTGGKQYKVREGETLKVEKLPAEVGDSIDFDQVMMIADGDKINVGAPLIEGGKVTAEVTEHGRGKKIMIIKFKRRKHHRKQMGHRQSFTEIKVTAIAG